MGAAVPGCGEEREARPPVSRYAQGMSTSILLACVGLGLLATGLSAGATAADGRTGTASLKNVEFLEQYAATRGFTHGTPKNISITPDGAAVFFLRSGPRSFVQDLFVVDTDTGKESVFLTADQILAGGEEKLTAEELARRERMRLASRGIASYSVSKDGKRVLVPLSGRVFVVERDGAKAGAATELKSSAGYPIDPQFSPDGTKVACVRDGDLYVMDIASGAETRLTTKTSETVTNGLAEFVAQEEMDRFHGFWWSPDSKQVVYEQADTAGMEVFHIADPMSPEKEPQSWPYPRPGKKNADVKLGVIDAAGGPTMWLEWDRATGEYIADVRWEAGLQLYVVCLNREQTVLTLMYDTGENDWAAARPDGMDLGSPRLSGRLEPMFRDRDAAWVNLFPNTPSKAPAGREVLMISERHGRAQIIATGTPGVGPRQISPDGLPVQGILGCGKAPDALYVAASEDPTQSHLYRVSFGTINPPAPKRLTSAAGVHGMIVSPKSDWCVQTAALMDGSSSWTIRTMASGGSGTAIRATREDPPWVPRLELEVVGERGFHTGVIRPRDFDATRKYPVIVNVYGGPHHQMVRATPQAYYLQQWIADQGFIIAMIDGRGTPGRGRDWERAIKDDLIGPALEDQVAGLKALGAKHPDMDLSRVGIYGWSFGGYFSAMATMQRPDVFHAGCAGAPVCDWLDYDTCYTERYLGVPKGPDDEVYKKSSVLTYCKDLQRPLMIIHGTSDDNVYFMHSLKMTQALFREGKPFEFLPLAGFTHMVPDPVVTTRLYSRIALFFKEKLGEPK